MSKMIGSKSSKNFFLLKCLGCVKFSRYVQTKVCFILLIFCAIPLISEDKKGSESTKNLVTDCNFENPALWGIKDGWTVVSGGMDGKNSFCYESSRFVKHYVLSYPLEGLLPKRYYRFSCWIKQENIKRNTGGWVMRGTGIGIDFDGNTDRMFGKFTGSYVHSLPTDTDWTLLSIDFYPPENFKQAKVRLFLNDALSGKVFFSNPSVTETIDWLTYLLQPSMQYAIESGENDFIFASFPLGVRAEDVEASKVKIKTYRAGTVIASKIVSVTGGLFRYHLNIEPGEYQFDLELLSKDDRILARNNKILFRVIDTKKQIPPKGNCRIDNNGITWVDGGKILPVGLILNNKGYSRDGKLGRSPKTLREDIARIKNSPFNCVMPYFSKDLKFPESKYNGIDAVREVLDELSNNNLKVIFGIPEIREGDYNVLGWNGISGVDTIRRYIVENLKNHSALMAWYIIDEPECRELAATLMARKVISSIDPFHPTWQIVSRDYLLPFFGGTSDIWGVDTYDIHHDIMHLQVALRNMDNLKKTAISIDCKAIWVVPQIHNPACYPEDNNGPSRNPTEQEIRSMCILEAIMGARGFIFYAYPDLFKPLVVNVFEKRWQEICRVGQELRNLEKYILSVHPSPNINVIEKQGKVLAKGFSDDSGRIKILIAAVGPGIASAEIKIYSKQKLKSKYGKSVLNADGVWKFNGENIDSDILIPIDLQENANLYLDKISN